MYSLEDRGAGPVYVEIIEEPQSDGTRFRYEKEGRSAGLVRGVNYRNGRKSFPAIKIHGYLGTAFVVVSLISLDGPPYYPHPHKLDGKYCKNGVYGKEFNCKKICSFTDLRIQCVKRKDVKKSLAEREALKIDPFGTGFSQSSDPTIVNFNAVRLCFQVLLPDENDKFRIPLAPIISAPIFDNKTISDLTIVKINPCSAPITGNEEVILLCGNVNKDDIEIIFYEEKDEEVIWTGFGKFLPHDVHRKAAISFKTPPYDNLKMQENVKCFVYLRRPSDGTEGKPREFTLYPSKKDLDFKRQKFESFRLDKLQVSNLPAKIPDDINARIKKVPVRSRANNLKGAVSQLDSNIIPRRKSAASPSVLGKENYCENPYLPFCNSQTPVSRPTAQTMVIPPDVPQTFPTVLPMSGLENFDNLSSSHHENNDTFAAVADDNSNYFLNNTIEMLSSLSLNFDHSNSNSGLNDLNATACSESRNFSSVGSFGNKNNIGELLLQDSRKLLQDVAAINDSLDKLSCTDFGLELSDVINRYLKGFSSDSL